MNHFLSLTLPSLTPIGEWIPTSYGACKVQADGHLSKVYTHPKGGFAFSHMIDGRLVLGQRAGCLLGWAKLMADLHYQDSVDAMQMCSSQMALA